MAEELPERVPIQTGGRIVLPKKLRTNLKLKEGSYLELKQTGKDDFSAHILVR